jgi:hypothetical protein
VSNAFFLKEPAVEFAEAIKFVGLATIVGEETGGQPNSFGNGCPFLLPRSRLTVTIATSTGIRANGDVTDFSPVKPDIVVRTSADRHGTGLRSDPRAGGRTARRGRFDVTNENVSCRVLLMEAQYADAMRRRSRARGRPDGGGATVSAGAVRPPR